MLVKITVFVILPISVDESVAAIHDRMPVILRSDELTPWINELGFREMVLYRKRPELENCLIPSLPQHFILHNPFILINVPKLEDLQLFHLFPGGIVPGKQKAPEFKVIMVLLERETEKALVKLLL